MYDIFFHSPQAAFLVSWHAFATGVAISHASKAWLLLEGTLTSTQLQSLRGHSM